MPCRQQDVQARQFIVLSMSGVTEVDIVAALCFWKITSNAKRSLAALCIRIIEYRGQSVMGRHQSLIFLGYTSSATSNIQGPSFTVTSAVHSLLSNGRNAKIGE